jgi:hypothetical protein
VTLDWRGEGCVHNAGTNDGNTGVEKEKGKSSGWWSVQDKSMLVCDC